VSLDSHKQLSLSLLGPIEAMWAGQRLSFATSPARALLAYLAINSDRTHMRETLAAMFWPDHTQASAYTNLRQTLARIRKSFPNSTDVDSFLVVTSQTLRFLPAAVNLDVAHFEALLAECSAHPHTDIAGCPACQERLEQAAALYRGELLHGLFLEASQPFEEWLRFKREVLHRQALDVFQMLIQVAGVAGDYVQMRVYAARELALEPWREEAHRHMMRALALQGDRIAALAQYETCRQVLDQELGIEPDVQTRVLYERIQAGNLAPVARAPTPQHNLPAALTPFIGRDAELAELTALMPDLRLLSLTGLGGMGKTRLALELARAQLQTFADGVFLVSLAPLTAASAIVPAIAGALGITVHGGDPHHGGDSRHALLQTLSPKHLLLVLDNFEHVLDGVDIVLDILQAAPHVKIIVTSRERLGVHAEHPYVLQGLPYTLHAPLADVADAAAVRLFVQSAERVQPHFVLHAANLSAVLRICELVQGMPLGLELAAAWTETLPLDLIAEEIEQSIDFLAAEWRDVPDRQRSMRAVFDWSWALLNDTERQVFKQLSVFRGGFTRQAASAVCGASLHVLTNLIRKALLRMNVAHGSTGRYEMHELLRQFAAEQLSADLDERTAVEARHSAFYLALAEAAAPNFSSADQGEWLDRIERDHDNIRLALAWAWERGELALGLRLAGALWPFWQRHCHLIEGRRWLEGFLAARGSDTIAPELRATALNGAGWLAHDQDDFVRAEALFTEGLRLDRALGHTGRVAAVLAHRGVMARGQGQYAEALALVEESLALAHTDGDRVGIAYALFRLGLITRERGDYARAITIYQDCLAAYEALGDRVGAVFALLGLGDVARDQGEASQVVAFCTESLAISRDMQQHWGVGFSLNNLALAALMQGERQRAAILAEEALTLFRTHGIRGGVIELLITQGQIACAQSDYGRARTLLAEGVALGWPAGPHWLVTTGLEELSRVWVAAGDVQHAVRLCGAAASWRASVVAPLQPYRLASYEANLHQARRALDSDDFTTSWAEGMAWRLEQAVVASTSISPQFQAFAAETVD
jgi:predicted ATPase/DNA-binding SARP family transcriptional activator